MATSTPCIDFSTIEKLGVKILIAKLPRHFSVPLINVNLGAFLSICANKSKSTVGHAWLWALLPLLLAAALAIPLLDVDAFNGDEPASLVAAGIVRSGPLSLEATWSYITNNNQNQAYGWPMLLAIWGRLVGWSELAVRALSLFFGMLTLAWVYRTGRDLLAPQAGLLAALLLSASVFFLAYHDPRARLHSDRPVQHALHLELTGALC